jgi:hypothetical protein
MPMSTLKDFLAEQAEKLKDTQQEAARRRDEWVASVNRLNEHIRGWLRSSDPEQILEVCEEPHEIREQGIGTYTAPGLVIALGARIVRVVPIARNVVGPLSETGAVHVIRAYGRVDLTDGLSKYLMYRVEKEPEDRWSIIEEDRYRLESLDQRAFEAALQGLLE